MKVVNFSPVSPVVALMKALFTLEAVVVLFRKGTHFLVGVAENKKIPRQKIPAVDL